MVYNEAGVYKLYKWATPILADEFPNPTIAINNVDSISEKLKNTPVPVPLIRKIIQSSTNAGCSISTDNDIDNDNCDCTCHTKEDDDDVTGTLIKMRTAIKRLRCKEKRLKEKMDSKYDPVLLSPMNFKADFLEKTLKLFPKDTADFIKQQIDHIGRGENGARYGDEYKDFCIQLSKKGADGYKFLQTTFVLPQIKQIQRRKKQKTMKKLNESKTDETEMNIDD